MTEYALWKSKKDRKALEKSGKTLNRTDIEEYLQWKSEKFIADKGGLDDKKKPHPDFRMWMLKTVDNFRSNGSQGVFVCSGRSNKVMRTSYYVIKCVVERLESKGIPIDSVEIDLDFPLGTLKAIIAKKRKVLYFNQVRLLVGYCQERIQESIYDTVQLAAEAKIKEYEKEYKKEWQKVLVKSKEPLSLCPEPQKEEEKAKEPVAYVSPLPPLKDTGTGALDLTSF